MLETLYAEASILINRMFGKIIRNMSDLLGAASNRFNNIQTAACNIG